MAFLKKIGRAHGITIDHDLSVGLSRDSFLVDHLATYGISGAVTACSYDAIQSLLALGTSNGNVYVFGQSAVQVQFTLQGANVGVKFLHLHGPHLVIIDNRNNLTHHSIDGDHVEQKARFSIRGQVTSIESDLSLDWLFIGMTDGSVDIWDLDRECLAQLSIENLYGRRPIPGGGKMRIVPIVAMALHPRDIGYLLVGYQVGAALFSFKENRAVKYFELEIPAFARGGDTDPAIISRPRRPRLTYLAWHPNGTYILTAHEDGCLAFWDAKTEGAPVHVRTIDDTFVNIPRGSYSAPSETMTIREPIVQVAWCSGTNVDDTSLVIAGGQLSNLPQKGLTYIDFGLQPSSLVGDSMTNYFAHPRKQRILPTFSSPLSFTVIPRSSPYYNGTHEPIVLLGLLETGELTAYSMPDCQPLQVARTLPPALSFVSPPITHFCIVPIPSQKWSSFIGRGKDYKNRNILMGGAAARRALRRLTVRNVMLSAHADGVIRVWDASHGEVESNEAFEIDVAAVIKSFDSGVTVDVISLSMAGMTGELVVGTYNGDVTIWRYGRRSRDDDDLTNQMDEMKLDPNRILKSTRHLHFNVIEGFLPLCWVNPQRGAPTIVKMSEVGFVAIGYDTGYICVIDLRGPAVIFLEDMANMLSDKDKKNRRRGSTTTGVGAEIPTVFEFAIMKLEGNEYSSLVLLTGTSKGRLISHLLVPTQSGGYSVHFDNSSSFATEGAVIALLPIRAKDGVSVIATPAALAGLGDGYITEAALVLVQEHGIRILGGVTNKIEKYEIEDRTLVKAQIVSSGGGVAIAVLGNNGRITGWSIPDIKRITEVSLPRNVVMERLHETIITPDGDIFSWTDKMECCLYTLWGTGTNLAAMPSDLLYDALKTVPPRPTISNLQWIMGTQYITPNDLNLLIGGPDRPLSKAQFAQQYTQDRQRALAERAAQRGNPGAESAASQGIFAQMSQSMSERAAKLGGISDTFGQLEQASSEWYNSIAKTAEKEKRKAIMGSITGKLNPF